MSASDGPTRFTPADTEWQAKQPGGVARNSVWPSATGSFDAGAPASAPMLPVPGIAEPETRMGRGGQPCVSMCPIASSNTDVISVYDHDPSRVDRGDHDKRDHHEREHFCNSGTASGFETGLRHNAPRRRMKMGRHRIWQNAFLRAAIEHSTRPILRFTAGTRHIASSIAHHTPSSA